MGAIHDLKKTLPGVHHVHDVSKPAPPTGHIIPAVVSVPVTIIQVSHGLMSVPAAIKL